MVPAPDGEDIVLLCPNCKQARTYSRPALSDEAGSRITGKEGEKEVCPACKAKQERVNTIEVGHIFKLGAKYSLSLGANFLDKQGKLNPIIMGCYGIGVSRLISAVIEQNNDENGIIWPKEVSPYKVIILPLDVTDEKNMQLALDIYNELRRKGIDALLDDRDERAGVKFKDADLLGVPLQVIIGRESQEKKIELKMRRTQGKLIKPKAEILKKIERLVNG
jgi:prolyl-tRNA synthetase